MNQYEVYIQNNFYKIILANTTGEALAMVAKDIQDGIPSMNYDQPHNIRIVKISNP